MHSTTVAVTTTAELTAAVTFWRAASAVVISQRDSNTKFVWALCLFIFLWQTCLSKGDEDDFEVELLESTAEKFSFEKPEIGETKKQGNERAGQRVKYVSNFVAKRDNPNQTGIDRKSIAHKLRSNTKPKGMPTS